MPVRRATATNTGANVTRLLRPTGANVATEIDHAEFAISPHEGERVFVRPRLPRITSFTLTPMSETTSQRTTRNGSLTLAWTVDPTTPAMAGRSYNYGSVLTVGESAVGHFRHGYSQRHGFGSLSVLPTFGGYTFITYFESTPAQTVGADLNRRYFIRNNIGTPPSGTTLASARAIEVNGTRYLLSPRGTSGWTSDMIGVPPFVSGQTYNIQIYAGGAAGDPSSWSPAFPNTLSATLAGTPAVYPTLALSTTTADGTRATHLIIQGAGSNTTVATPAQDMVATLTATNVEGTVAERVRYDLRTAVANISLTPVVVPQSGVDQSTQIVRRFRIQFDADPLTSVVLSSDNGDPASQTFDVGELTPNGTRYDFMSEPFTYVFGSAVSTRTPRVTVGGVNASNQAAQVVSTATVTVPARAGG